MTKMFSELGLSAELLKAIDKMGFEQASPIQAEAIPLLIDGRDVVGQSQTGSGKTVAFAAPAVQMVDPQKKAAQVLILCPTRELALQVTEEVHKLAAFKRGVHALPIYGGQSYERQFYGLKQGAQLIIGTPGRVMDHMRRGTLRLDALRLVVLDEADVMLDMGFRDDMEVILKAAPESRQTVFFSATMPPAIRELIRKFGRNPESVRIEQKTVTVPTVDQVYYEVDRRFKLELLTRLIDMHDYKLGIIFCNTKRTVDDLADHLGGQGYSSDRLHGDMSQAMRDRVMNKFRKAGIEFLVATDVAARGIDVENVQVVFNYDLPYDPEDYVHRIGRTGRAGKSGRAISFAGGREVFQIRQIERYTRTKIPRGKVPTVSEVEEAREAVTLDKLRTTIQSGDFKRQDRLVECLLKEGFTPTDIVSALLHQLDSAVGGPPVPGRKEAEREPAPLRKLQVGSRQSEFHRPAIRPDRERITRPSRPQPRPPAAVPAGQSAPKPPDLPLQAPSEPPAFPELRERKQLKVQPPPQKASRRTPSDQTRLYINAGAEMGVEPADVQKAVSGATGLPADVVGTVDVRERHLFVDVAAEHANSIIAKLNRSGIKGRKVKVKLA